MRQNLSRLVLYPSVIVFASVLLIVCSCPVGAQSVSSAYQSFSPSNANDFIMNGNPAFVGNVLRMIPAQLWMDSSVYLKNRVSFKQDRSFSAYFAFRYSSPIGVAGCPPGADAIVFTIQSDSPNAIGGAGGYLGFRGLNAALGVEFDDWFNYAGAFPEISDPDDNHIGIDIGSSGVRSVATLPISRLNPGWYLDDGAVNYVWVDYDGQSNRLEIRFNRALARPAVASLSYSVDLKNVFAKDAYVGFTSASGAASANMDVLSFYFVPDYLPQGVDANYVFAGGIKSVSVSSVSGTPAIDVTDLVRCSADLENPKSGSNGPVSYSFIRIMPDGSRVSAAVDSNDRFDCNGICKAGESIACRATLSPNPSVASLISSRSMESPPVPLTDRCISAFGSTSIQSGARTHNLGCVRDDLGTTSFNFIKKECVGNDDPIGSSNIALIGDSVLGGASYRVNLQAGDAPSAKVRSSQALDYNLGSITVDLRPSWNANDGQDHFFFSSSIDSNNWMSLLKTADGRIRCEYDLAGTVAAANIPLIAADWSAGSHHMITMSWDVPGKVLKCRVDDNPAVGIRLGGSFSAISSPEFVVGGAMNGGAKAGSLMNLTLWRTIEPTVYYCAQDAIWAKSLDAKGKPSCEYSKLKWTGTACCGEPADKQEFYSDPIGATPPSTIGVCWNSTYIPSGTLVPGTQNKVISIAGSMLGCGIPASDPLLSIRDSHAARALIQPTQSCTLAKNIGGNAHMNLFCSPKLGQWKDTTSNKDLVLSSNPTDPNDKNCCEKLSSCWDGNACVPDQSQEASLSATRGYRCVKGEWASSNFKYTPDRSGRGYCPRDSDCLWNPRGSPEKNYLPESYFAAMDDPLKQPACLADGQYVEEFLCSEGDWSSRAKAIALEMINVGESQSNVDYALFCGEYTDVLNFIDYDPETLGLGSVKGYLESGCSISGRAVPCVNNFCAVRLSNGAVGFGTSLNIPIDDPDKSFLKALNLDPTSCNDAAIDDGKFHECVTGEWYSSALSALMSAVGAGSNHNNVLLYNHGLMAVISMPQVQSSITGAAAARIAKPSSRPVVKKERETKIKAPITALKAFADTSERQQFKDPLANASLFDQLYILKGPSRNYFAFLEEDVFFDEYVDVAALAYDGITVSDPITGKAACELLSDRIAPSKLKKYDCAYDAANGRLRMVAISKTPASGGQGTPLRDFWRDMTSKLR